MHLAAESHVDRSIAGPARIHPAPMSIGTHACCEAALRLLARAAGGGARTRFRFLHISTDEVYGSLGAPKAVSRDDALRSALALLGLARRRRDHLVRAWHQTYGLPVVISNCSNNYGPLSLSRKS